MTSIADTERTAAPVELRATAPRAGRNFNLRAYLAGAGATTALIAGAIVVFASLGAYVAFNGLPVGSGNENATQLTIGSAEVTPTAGLLGRAAGAVAATAAASTATAPGTASAQQGSGPGAGPDASPADPPPGGPAPGPTVDPTIPPPGATPTDPGATGPAAAPVGGAVGGVSDATGLPLDDATNGITGPVDDALGGVGDTFGGQQIGQAAGGLTESLLD